MEMTNNPSNTEMKLIEQPEYLEGTEEGEGSARAEANLLRAEPPRAMVPPSNY